MWAVADALLRQLPLGTKLSSIAVEDMIILMAIEAQSDKAHD